MAKKRAISLEFPLGGLDERFAIQRQKPFTTVDALNVRPDGTLEQRTRGGSRPGLGRAFGELLGSGNPVNMLAQVRSVASGKSVWEDSFDGPVDADIDTEVWEKLTPGVILPDSGTGELPTLTGFGKATTPFGFSAPSGTLIAGLRKAVPALDDSEPYTIRMDTTRLPAGVFSRHKIYAEMTGTDPKDGIVVSTATSIASDGKMLVGWDISSFINGIVQTTVFGSDNSLTYSSGPLTYFLTVNGTTVTLLFGTLTLASTIVATLTGSRVGFGMKHTTIDAGGSTFVGNMEFFRINYSSITNVEPNKNFVVAASNESVYIENNGVLDTVSTSLTIASDRQIMAQSRAGSLYIADHSDAFVTGDNGVMLNSVLDDEDGTITDWTAVADADDDIVVITNGVGGTTNGNYRIDSVSVSGGLTLATNPGDGTCSFRVERALKKFDPQTGILTVLVESAGSVPAGNSLIALYQDRLVIAGAALAPHVWYMSKQGDPTNWNLGGTSPARAVAGLTTDAGQHPEPITAVAPFHDDYLIFGSPTSLWVLRGNPATVGGFLDNISQKIGIIDKQSWAYDPVGGLYFMGRAGLYYLTPNAVGEPQPVSESKLPDELVNLDVNSDDIMLAYDVAARGLHICITPKLGGVTTQWWLDTELQSFWKVSLAADHHAFSLLSYDADSPNDAGVLLGCKDGRIRKFSNSFASDDGTAISSHVLIGPVALGGSEYLEGKVKEIITTLDVRSGDVAYSVLTGDSAQAASTATATTTGTITSGANNSIRPQGRGRYFYLKLANGNGTPWAVEGIIAKLAAAGRFRK